MITYEDIKKVNETMRTTPIGDKNYAEVPQRIKAFRMLYPQGYIKSEILSIENGVVIMKAEVGYYDENGNAVMLGTGTAYEKENSGFINKTSYLENCETSAIGRALGMMGLGIDVSIASYEEVSNAKLNQEKKPSKSTSKPAPAPVEEESVAPAPTKPALNLTLNANAPKVIQDYFYEFAVVLRGELPKVLYSLKLNDVNDIPVEQWKRCIDLQAKWRESHPLKEGE